MTDFIVNPRRAPRAPIRCEVRAALREGAFWLAFTADYGPRGCQLAAPTPLAPGTRVFLSLANEHLPAPVRLAGHVAWSSESEPWRIGVAFDGASLASAHFFFEQLAAAYPHLEGVSRPPERLPADAPLAPTPPPASVPCLSADERAVLDAVGAGAPAIAVRERLGERFEGAVNALFALLGRRHLVVGAPDAAAAEAWKATLAGAR
jgi:hypothetical protein